MRSGFPLSSDANWAIYVFMEKIVLIIVTCSCCGENCGHPGRG